MDRHASIYETAVEIMILMGRLLDCQRKFCEWRGKMRVLSWTGMQNQWL